MQPTSRTDHGADRELGGLLRRRAFRPLVDHDLLVEGGDKYFLGVPDLVVEVLSPGTSHVDPQVKFTAYEKAGVPEYWLVDPKSRSITVYVFDENRR